MEKKYAVLAIAAAIIIVVAGFLAIYSPQASNNGAVVQSSGKEPIKVGVITILTGDLAAYGQYGREAIDLAVEEINSKGGVNGRKIKLIYEDDQATPQNSATAMKKLLEVDGVNAVISFTGSGATAAHAPLAESNRTPLVIALASAEKIKNSGDYVFRVVPSDAQQGKDLARISRENGYGNVAILYVNNEWGVGLRDSFGENFSNIVAEEAMEDSPTSVASQLEKIRDSGADVLFMPCYIQGCIRAVAQMKELGIEMPVLSADVFYNQEILDALGSNANGVILTRPADGSGKEWEAFKEKFKQRYNKDPNINHAFAYDGAHTLYRAFSSGGTDKEKVKAELYKTSFIGASGDNTFDSLGEVSKPFAAEIVRGGKFVAYSS